jgi:hypothetical protein
LVQTLPPATPGGVYEKNVDLMRCRTPALSKSKEAESDRRLHVGEQFNHITGVAQRFNFKKENLPAREEDVSGIPINQP